MNVCFFETLFILRLRIVFSRVSVNQKVAILQKMPLLSMDFSELPSIIKIEEIIQISVQADMTSKELRFWIVMEKIADVQSTQR